MPNYKLSVNTLQLELVSLAPGETLVVGDIPFCNIKYVAIYLDGTNVLQTDARFEDSWLVWEEVVNSAKQSGQYLLFTAANGYADEGGWDYIQVVHQEKYVEWDFLREGEPFRYIFDIQDYRVVVSHIESLLVTSPASMRLEPTHIIFPEE
jgi:hypothetical protein